MGVIRERWRAYESQKLLERAQQLGLGAGVSAEDLAVALVALQDKATAATDSELASGLATKQDAATAATDTELAAVAALLASKQDASTAATDAELASGLASVGGLPFPAYTPSVVGNKWRSSVMRNAGSPVYLGTSQLTLGRRYASPWMAPQDQTIDQFAVHVQGVSGVAATTFKGWVAVYADRADGAGPGARLGVISFDATATTGVKTFAPGANVVMKRGQRYWTVWGVDSPVENVGVFLYGIGSTSGTTNPLIMGTQMNEANGGDALQPTTKYLQTTLTNFTDCPASLDGVALTTLNTYGIPVVALRTV